MRIDRWHPRRPEGAWPSSTKRLAGYRRQFRSPEARPLQEASEADSDKLVDEVMKAALAGEVRADITFGAYASLFSFFRSAVMQEGRLVEMAIAQAIQRNDHLKLLPTKAMPIVAAAQEMLKRTPADEITGVRFPSRVHAAETYKPDLVVVNRTRHSGLILDIKRSLGSYRPQQIDRLRFRMLAVAAIAPEWIAEHQHTLLVAVETAIVDAADEVSDPARGVFRLSEIDALLETEGAADSIRQVREVFSQRVQMELARRCGAFGAEGSGTDRMASSPDSAAPEAPRRFGYARRSNLH